jgi:hypothetical protein
MFYLNYDLAKQLMEERRAQATAQRRAQAAKREKRRWRRQAAIEAEVIELCFAPSCEQGRLGA